MRKGLSPARIEALSGDITNCMPDALFKGVAYIHVFYPIVSKAEYNSLLLVERLRRDFPAVKIVLSRSNLLDCTLEHILWDEHTQLSANKWHIVEPVSGECIAPASLDMIIIPLLAFDRMGHRLGYGKGFYDRFLAECPQARKIGVSFFEPEERLEVDAFDIPMDECFTPSTHWKFSR